MNNRGMAATILIYTVFVFLVFIIMLLLNVITSSINSSIYSGEAIKEHVNKIVPYDVCLEKSEC